MTPAPTSLLTLSSLCFHVFSDPSSLRDLACRCLLVDQGVAFVLRLIALEGRNACKLQFQVLPPQDPLPFQGFCIPTITRCSSGMRCVGAHGLRAQPRSLANNDPNLPPPNLPPLIHAPRGVVFLFCSSGSNRIAKSKQFTKQAHAHGTGPLPPPRMCVCVYLCVSEMCV